MAPRKPRDREMLFDSVIALVFILVACVDLCDGATVVDVYRLIQYDMSGVPFGSRLASLNHHAASLHFSPHADLSRTVLLIPLRELNLSFVKEYIAESKPLGGLIFLLPRMFSFENKGGMGSNLEDGSKELLKDTLAELEQVLIHTNLPYPVYFAFEDDNIDAVLTDIKKNDATGQPATATTGGYKFVVSAPEPKKLVSPPITNIQGWLAGLKTDDDAHQLPTIVIVASYDTFGAAPALSAGSDSNGSGIVALLEVARLFSLLYSNPKTRGQYNLLFGLTSGGPYNYNGTRKVAWEHEQFSRLRVTAATLSELSMAPELLERTGGLVDSRQFVNEAAIVRSVKLIAESLARHIYGHQGKNIQIFADNSNLAVNPSYIRSWLDVLSQTPRVAPFFSKDDPFVMALKKELEDHTDEVNLQREVLDGMFTFYDSTRANLNIYQVASVTFDLLLLLVVGSYLIVLFSFLVITTKGLDDLISLFRRPPSRKVKTA
ncbi:nicalin-1 isoform X2 [Abrus precatorius]|uniref:Nicalin-1 isoform X2 n=1 Tax=Abrus precatorius TaxID=3816 RepID=A0A8B8KNP7_ABRPR|nr:nicalin-1 isoform X2 [Abrus precatorius]